ncbi:MAG: hypothetical protein KatS3mg036_0497 [Ignavibacterium sp.]|uniref:hypothetical protein n=1 Tax=Ignavibacterium sp. TaxID=2651167 RepID=UPI0021DD7D16|nr:hypothetical protein [Ignavibacterium sp.]BDQ01943.1 MAG: hypothetical protein KatS3mg037_0518 [Ignavibacterium sp.]GIV45679.1 MAG: hypothetical protein KatS3mg036_0497 [Ignavibacterium sp.]
MKIKIFKLLSALDGLKKLAERDLPAPISFNLARAFQQIDKELELFEKQRVKLLEKYAVKQDDGSLIIPDDNTENREKYLAELNQLMDCEIEIPYEPININNLGEIKLSVSDMLQIQDFFINK